MQRVGFPWVVSFLVLAAVPSVVHAGPVEQLTQLVFKPGSKDVAALRYINGGDGIFYASDAKSFKLACTASVDPALTRSGPIVITADGKTLMGMFDGMYQDDGTGCGWMRVPDFQMKWVSGFALDPTDSTITYAITSNGNPGSMNGMFKRDASGKWSDLGTRDDILIGSLQVVDNGGKLRFYEGAARGQKMVDGGSEPNYFIRVSNDAGATWDEHAFDAGNATMRILAVDPKNPDRIVISVDRAEEQDSFMVSNDQGASFTEYLKVTQIGGLALAPDGRVWLGDDGDTTMPMAPIGLYAAPSLDKQPTKIADWVVQCLTYEPESKTLYACQRWSLGTVDQTAGDFSAMLKLQEATSFLSCGGMDLSAVCKTQLCAAYCGPGHFAQAPLCEAYSDPLCGPAASEDGASGTSGGSGGTSGTGGTGGGSGGASGSGGTSGGGGGMSVGVAGSSGSGSIGATQTDAGAAGGTPKAKTSSGCSCSTAPRGGLAGGGAAVGLFGIAVAAMRRRRRNR